MIARQGAHHAVPNSTSTTPGRAVTWESKSVLDKLCNDEDMRTSFHRGGVERGEDYALPSRARRCGDEHAGGGGGDGPVTGGGLRRRQGRQAAGGGRRQAHKAQEGRAPV